MHRAHQASPARTDFRSFPGRTHWLIAQDGWEEVAQGCIDWIGSLAPEESDRGSDEVEGFAEKEGSMRVGAAGSGGGSIAVAE
jgi:hypothetical protein